MDNEKCDVQSADKPADCVDLQKKGKKSGVYRIFPEGSHQGIMVLCDMEIAGGGWAVVQNRYDGSQNFYQGWHDYKHGFGNLGGEFWFGLDNLYRMTGNYWIYRYPYANLNIFILSPIIFFHFTKITNRF